MLDIQHVALELSLALLVDLVDLPYLLFKLIDKCLQVRFSFVTRVLVVVISLLLNEFPHHFVK